MKKVKDITDRELLEEIMVWLKGIAAIISIIMGMVFAMFVFRG